jgi:type IV pilus assembly protein PilQ
MKQLVANQAVANQQSGGGGASNRILSTRGAINFDVRTNQIFVTDIPSKLEEVATIIAKIDIPLRQVMIESRIVIAEETFGRSLGIKLGFADYRGVRGGVPGYSVGSTQLSPGGNLNAVGAQTGQTGGSNVTFSDTNFVNLPATAQGGFNAATFALSLFTPGANRFLNLELSALESDGKGKIVSSPRVITADQQKALIEQGEEIPYQAATSSGATSVQFRKASLKLEVTPQITPEGSVILDVDVAKDSRGAFAGSAGFAINTKHVQTKVLVENGGTVVIGGIFEQAESDDVTKVPFLGDVPYLGNLFKTRTKSSTRTEMLIFLTPKVLPDRTAGR